MSLTAEQTAKVDLVRGLLDRALREQALSADWFYFVVEPVAERTRLPIDGDWTTRRWWFVLREV